MNFRNPGYACRRNSQMKSHIYLKIGENKTFVDFLRTAGDNHGYHLVPIQHKQSSSQHYQFDQITSTLECEFVIGTRMNEH